MNFQISVIHFRSRSVLFSQGNMGRGDDTFCSERTTPRIDDEDDDDDDVATIAHPSTRSFARRRYNAFRLFTQNQERYRRRTGKAFVPSFKAATASKNFMDRWVMSKLQSTIVFVRRELGETYQLYTVVREVVGFIDLLCKWYLRLNRDRLKGTNTTEEDCVACLSTCYEVRSFSLIRTRARIVDDVLSASLVTTSRAFLRV